MKSYCFPFILLLIFSCGSNQSISNNKQNNISKVNNSNSDCSAQVKIYAENSYRLYGQAGDAFKGRNGSYTIRFEKPHPIAGNNKITNTFQIWVDENCKVVNSKKLGSRF